MTHSFHALPGSRQSDFDSGPLSWVMEEIREALAQSRTALFDAIAKGEDTGSTQLQHALAFLHQAHGALQIIDVNGVSILTDAIEDILRRMSSKDIPLNHANARIIEQAYIALTEYLQELLSGDEQQPLRLFPYYRDLQELRGSERIHPADLFFPEHEIAPEGAGGFTESEADRAEPNYVSLRRRFEKVLLQLLVNQGAPANMGAAATLREIVAEIFNAQENRSSREFWFAMHGFADRLAAMTHPATMFDKQICGRMNRQIKLLAQGSSSVSEKLLVDALYCLAIEEPNSPVAAEVREAFRLAGTIPAEFEKKRYGQIDTVALGLAKSALSQAKNDWNRITKGDAGAAKSFSDVILQLAETSARLGTSSLQKLFSAIGAKSDTVEYGTPLSDHLALEIATDLLFAENALAQLNRLPADFPQRVDMLVERISLITAGSEPSATAQWMNSLMQQSQQQQTVNVLATEMESGLRHIERILDEYNIDHTKHATLADIDPILHQISGVLSVLGQEDAMQAVLHTRALIQQFSDSNASHDNGSAFASIPDAVTQNITALGFFVEMLPQQPETARNRFVFDQEQGVLHANLLEKAIPRQSTVRTADVAFDPILDIDEHAIAQATSPAPPPTASVAAPQAVSDEDIDAELLDIFMMEAEEVLNFVRQTVPEARHRKDAQEQLSTLRRSFHTLKGSGRMVGLTAFSDAAYSIEQVMNLWLAEARTGTPDLFALLDKAAEELGEWVDELKISGKSERSPAPLAEAAERVKQGEPFRFDGAIDAPAVSDQQDAAIPSPTELANIIDGGQQPLSDAEINIGTETDNTVDGAKAVTTVVTAPPLLELSRPHSNIIEFPGMTLPAKTESDSVKRIGDLEIAVPLYNIFVTESDDILRFLAQDFSEWQHEPGRAVSNRAVQAAHTLAGISATVGLTSLHDVAHALEVCLETLEYQPLTMTASAFATLHSCIERMKQMQQQIAIGEMPVAQPEIIQALRVLQPEAATPAATDPTMVETDVPEVTTASAASLSAGECIIEPDEIDGGIALSGAAEYDEHDGQDDIVEQFRDTLDPDLLPVFIDEGRDLLPQIGEALRNWLNTPSDTRFAPEILRQLHTAKGSARMAGAMRFGQHLHLMESHIEDILHSGNATAPMLEELLARHDHSLQMFDQLLYPEKEIPKAYQPAPQPAAHETVDVERPVTAEDMPSTVQPAQELRSHSASPPTAQPSPAAQVARVRVRADVLDRLVNQAGEVSIARSKIENEVDSLRQSLTDLTDNLSRLRSQLREVEIQAESQIASRMAQTTDREFDPLEFDRFSRLQELTRMMSESVDDVASIQDNLIRTVTGATADLESQAQMTRALQQDLMQVRMVPFASIAERLYQVTRQTAKEVAKPVNLDIRGTTVEIDRSVLERMIGPLEHLLRNAIVHGIEPRAERKSLGKKEVGELLLEIRQEGNEVVLHLADDGKGLDWARIRERARALGLISAERELTQSEMEDLIFQSGFSTADEVTSIAGRGVGMDVVRTDTASLGGRINVRSETGKGTTFTINLPLTLAVSSVVLLAVGSKTYAVPSVLVEQVQQLRPDAVAEAKRAGGITYIGERIPVHLLSTLLGDTHALAAEKQLTSVVMLRSGDERVALQVDDVIGNREVVVKNIGPQLARLTGIVGATVLGSGDIVLILNPVPLVHRVFAEHDNRRTISGVTTVPPTLDAALGNEAAPASIQAEEISPLLNVTPPPISSHDKVAPSEHASHKKNIVMVVDDSLTVRRVTQRFLQREGYQVVLAKDGVDALEKLQEIQPDVMLVDIEMPRMDGFDLIRNVRSDNRISKTPIIMITSRTASKHRNYAMELGANEYYGKPFQEQQLLDSIEGFVGKEVVPT